jgi:hypothetical protein
VAVTLASLRAAHPEFTTFDATALQASIDQATDLIEATIFEDVTQHDTAITWYACYLASTSPYGRDMRRKGDLEIPEGYYAGYMEVAKPEARAHRFITGQTG